VPFQIGVIGMWHLGCVLCASWTKLGNSVRAFDYDAARIKNLQDGKPPIYEPHLSESLKSAIEIGLLEFSNDITSLSACDFVFLAYDTPVRDDDSTDTTIVQKAVDDVKGVMKHGAILIVSSQVPVGFCARLRQTLRGADRSLDVVYSPENLRLGEAIDCYLHPGRIILGLADKHTEDRCRELFSQIGAQVLSMSFESSELVKHAINSYLASSIVFANNLADVCEVTGAHVDDVVRGMKSDPRIGSRAYLSPGIGFSGGTLGRDLKVLDGVNADTGGYARLFGVIHHLNSERKYAIFGKIESILGNLAGLSIGVLGVTYKPGTSTLRRSLPLEIVELMVDKGAIVAVYDPKADFSELPRDPKFTIASAIEQVAKNSEMLLLLTEWNDFKEYNWGNVPAVMKRAIFFDAKNCLDRKKMQHFGFQYYSIGRRQ